MSIRMSRESYSKMMFVFNTFRWTMIFWLVVGTWLCPGCREALPGQLQTTFNNLDSLVLGE